MTPAHAYTMLGVVLLLSSVLSGAWALRWCRREGGRVIAALHAVTAIVGAVAALRMVSLAGTRAEAFWWRVTDPEVILVTMYLLLQAGVRILELWREYDRELYAARVRHRLRLEGLEPAPE